jgi:A/G-specific adenine glycosylase
MRDQTVSAALLGWYDKHARVMPWRVAPEDRKNGRRPDPYRVWMSEIMLQQTTVAAVRSYFLKFTERWPTVTDLAAAKDADVMAEWAGLGYYARARNLLKCARVVVEEFGGSFPASEAELLKLPGVGPYTAAAVASIAFDEPATVVDGNVERVISRLHDIHEELPKSRPLLRAQAEQHTPKDRPGDYAQAIMDLGATICTPRNPVCALCPLQANCVGFEKGTAPELPKKIPKTPKPTRYGYAYIGRRTDGALLLETRPEKGLLGGMLGWPGSEWTDNPSPAPPIEANWTPCPTEARHTFTHFHLELKVLVADLGADTEPTKGTFVETHLFQVGDLPTVMRKAYAIAAATWA